MAEAPGGFQPGRRLCSSGRGWENGHLLFLREGTLMAQPLERKTLEPAGDAVPGGRACGLPRWPWGFSPCRQMGYWLIAAAAPAVGSQLVWFDREGKALATLGPPGGL